MAVLEKWGGGLTDTLHNQVINGSTLEVDLIKEGGTTNGFEDGVFKLLDMGQKNNEVWLDFYTGTKSAAALGMHMLVLKNKLVGRPDAQHLSSTGAFSGGLFGSEADEAAAYDKWGWTYTDAQKEKMAPYVNASVEWEDIHDESETDDAEAMLLQWVRTGQRGFFDVGEAWAKYYKTHYAFRSKGWHDEGQYFTAAYVSQYANRTHVDVGGEPGYWSTGYKWRGARADVEAWVGCHYYGAGLLDYYCLTGDIDALEGGIDLSETAWLFSTNTNRGDTLNSTNGGSRSTGRQLLLLTRLYEVLRDSASFYRANLRSKMVVRSKRKDPRGFLYGFPALWSNWDEDLIGQVGFPDSLKAYCSANNISVQIVDGGSNADTAMCINGSTGERWMIKKLGGSWEQQYSAHAVERFYRLTGDEDARDYVIGYGQNAAKTLAYKCGIVPYTVYYDFPIKGKKYGSGYLDWDPAHNACIGAQSTDRNSLPEHSGWYTVYFPGACALAYRYSGFPYLIKQAYDYWNLGSKRGYRTTYYYRPENEVYTFAYHFPPKNDGLINSNHLFYEAVHHGDTVPPEPITDLGVSRNADKSGLIFVWTTPADNNGQAVEYQLKFYKDLPIVDYLNYDYKRDDGVQIPWWYAVNVKGEPYPQATGAPEYFELIGSFPESDVFYAAVRTRDANGNLSSMSNLVKIDNTIRIDNINSIVQPMNLVAAPNPSHPVVTLKVYLRESHPENLQLSIFDVSGKLIKTFKGQDLKIRNNYLSAAWRGLDNSGKQVASGIYVVSLAFGNHVLKRKITLMK
jgi:hypothetical protein